MIITLNGEPRQFDQAQTITEMLDELALIPTKVAVERNLQIVPRSVFDETMLREGDRIEIVRFIGGG